MYKVITDKGIYNAKIKGSMFNQIQDLEEYPRVGDFVAVNIIDDQAIIHGIITRKNFLAKKITGNRFDSQILATNLDYVFIIMGLNQDFNLRRLERLLSITRDGNIKSIILLTKMDLCEDYQQYVDQCKEIALTDDVYAISALYNQNMEIALSLIKSNHTYAFIGSSGVGKSTIINYLMEQDIQQTLELSVHNKGRHATTTREMFLLPNGGIVIDTPGMKSIGLLEEQTGVQTSFSDIELLAKSCRFNDCQHHIEPGCKVLEAVSLGNLSSNRLENYHKLIKESKFMEKKAKIKEKQRNKKLK